VERKLKYSLFQLLMIKNKEKNNWIIIAIMSGFALINNNKVTILVNEADNGSVKKRNNNYLN
jgi:F0F1-type ATP synthase epsilon subunit